MDLERILDQFKTLEEYQRIEQHFRQDRRQLLKALLTIHSEKVENSVVEIIEHYLKNEQERMEIIDCNSLETFAVVHDTRLSIWRGDITQLRVDAIVNAANSAMLGCFRINHPCIGKISLPFSLSSNLCLTCHSDNAIHCAAGPGLRNECLDFMHARDQEPFPVGVAYLTAGYALPSRYVLHCVGPAAQYPGHEQPEELKSCYHSCLSTSQSHRDIHSVAFCCISTGVFGYPAEAACEVALQSVMEWLESNKETNRIEHIIFNVFTKRDLEIYQSFGEKMFQVEIKEEKGKEEEENKACVDSV